MKNDENIRGSKEIDYEKFHIDMNEFINSNEISSPTNYVITTSTENKFTYIYEKKNSVWNLLFKWTCTVGKNEIPTMTGVFSIGEKYQAIGNENSSAKYAVKFVENYYYYSIIYDSKGKSVKDDRLGVSINDGCIRLATSNIKWIYDNLDTGTTVIIN